MNTNSTQTDGVDFQDAEFSNLLLEDTEDFGLDSILREFPPDGASQTGDTDSRTAGGFCFSSPLPEHRYMLDPIGYGTNSLPPPPRPKSPWGRFDPYDSVEDQDKEYVGFATLPNQVHRKSVKKGFEFTLMVVGESGLGKSTLVNSLFLTDLYKGRVLHNAPERVAQTVAITKNTVEIVEKGVKLKLNIVDTPGFGDAVNNIQSWRAVSDYVDRQFEQYRRDETGLNRKNIQDNRIHCCLYFISPYGHGLRPLDVEFMRSLHEKVNIVPVLAKADSLTSSELRNMKTRIMTEIDKHRIKIYQFPDCDEDEDELFRRQDLELKRSIPFAVVGSNAIVESEGRRFRARIYPWGVVEVENVAHSDFVHLRNMLVRTHMQDLKDMTQDVHYENYRAQYLCRGASPDLSYSFGHFAV